MKEKTIAFILAMLIALGLSACDGSLTGTANDNDVMGDEHSSVQQQTPGGTNDKDTTGSNTDAKNRSSTYAGGSYRNNNGSTYGKNGGTYGGNGGVSDYSTTNPANGYRQTTTWWKMLQNGRVHDSDGYLLDGENAHWE